MSVVRKKEEVISVTRKMEGGNVSEKETQIVLATRKRLSDDFIPLLSCSVSLHNCPVHKDSPITIYSFKIEEGQERCMWHYDIIRCLL